nr:hypothetical protein [Clostridium puniceum]
MGLKLQAGTAWYYLKADGVMATGWQNVDGHGTI